MGNSSDAFALPQPGDLCLTWMTGWAGFAAVAMQWLSGDGGQRLTRSFAKGLPRGCPTLVMVMLSDGKVLESRRGGAVISSLGRYRRRLVLHARLPLSDDQRTQVCDLARQ
jgi:hypothetical protein